MVVKKIHLLFIFGERKAEWNGDFNGDTVGIAAVDNFLEQQSLLI